jgi:methionine-rich copper-binding protein CopC
MIMHIPFARGVASCVRVAAPVALAGALLALAVSQAHAIAGDRVFPATMAVDDPGVGDEMYFRFGHIKTTNDDGNDVNVNTASFEWDKLITSNLAFSVDGKSAVDAGNRKVIKAALSNLAPGAYTVTWVAVANDGHRTQSHYTFTVM